MKNNDKTSTPNAKIEKHLTQSHVRSISPYMVSLSNNPVKSEDIAGATLVDRECKKDANKKHSYFIKKMDCREYLSTSIANIMSQARKGMCVPSVKIGVNKDNAQHLYLLSKQIEENSYEPDAEYMNIESFPYMAGLMIINGEEDPNRNNYLFDVVDENNKHLASRIDHGSEQFDDASINNLTKVIQKKGNVQGCPPYLLFSQGVTDAKYLKEQVDIIADQYVEMDVFNKLFDINGKGAKISITAKPDKEVDAMLFIRSIKDVGEMPKYIKDKAIENISKDALHNDGVKFVMSDFTKEQGRINSINDAVYKEFKNSGAIDWFNNLNKNEPYASNPQFQDMDWSLYASASASSSKSIGKGVKYK